MRQKLESTSLLKHQPLGSSCLVSTCISFGEHCGICVLDRLPPQTGRSHTGCWAALCTQVQVQWHNLNLKSFGFSPKVQTQRHLHMRQSVSLYHHHILSHDVPAWQQLPGSWAAQSTQNHTKLVAAWLLFQLEQVSTLLLKGLWNRGNACGTVALWHCEWCDSLKFAQHP